MLAIHIHDRCGTPEGSLQYFVVFSTLNSVCSDFEYSVIKIIIEKLNGVRVNLVLAMIKMSWFTLLKAFLKSMNTTPVLLFRCS